jgi:mitochondrial chaperone BCS1
MEPILPIDANLIATVWGIIQSIPAEGGKWLTEELNNNQFLVATIIPALLLAAWYAFSGIFRRIGGYLRMMITSEVTFNSDNEYFHEMTQYLYDKALARIFQRFFTISSSWQTEGLILTIGYGTSIGFIGPWPVIINRSIEESQSAKFKEKVVITIIGGRNSAIRILMANMDAKVANIQSSDEVHIYQIDKDGDMMRTASKPKRAMDTVIIPDEDKQYIIDKLDHFMASEEYYISKGLPYHMGVILSGPPGTGKTSLIHAIASHYNRNVCFSTGSEIRIGQMDLTKTILVIEDIDSNGMAVAHRATQSTEAPSATDSILQSISGQNMASILNILDGLISPHGLITIATTNRYEALDPAIVRPGRFDVHLEFKNMAWPEWNGLCKLLDRVTPVEESEYVVISPAQARYMLLYYSDADIKEYFKNPVDAMVNVPSVTESVALVGANAENRPTPGKRRPRRG